MKIKVEDGYVADPGHKVGMFDIYIDQGKIEAILPNKKKTDPSIPALQTSTFSLDAYKNAHTISAKNMVVAPGLVDMHVHLREPGHEYKETIFSGCDAAAAGGFTAVCAMPNTKPVNDNRQVTQYISEKSKESGKVNVYPVAAISLGLKGESLCEFGELKDAGAIAFSDDGFPVMNSQLMRRALEYAKGFGIPIISHCEDLELAANGVMNEGIIATQIGLAGIPNAAESVMVMRDIALCDLTDAHLHIAHVSAKESVWAIRQAKKRGVRVTAETAPHYFTLTDGAILSYNTNAKMNPPLRTQADVDAICEGLADGTIDAIASDHAPHSKLEKNIEFDRAANGIIGLETSLGLSLTLVQKKILSIEDLIRKMAINPSKIIGIENGFKIGKKANITIFDPDYTYTVNADDFKSLSFNSPYMGWELKGKVICTLVNGKIVSQE